MNMNFNQANTGNAYNVNRGPWLYNSTNSHNHHSYHKELFYENNQQHNLPRCGIGYAADASSSLNNSGQRNKRQNQKASLIIESQHQASIMNGPTTEMSSNQQSHSNNKLISNILQMYQGKEKLSYNPKLAKRAQVYISLISP